MENLNDFEEKFLTSVEGLPDDIAFVIDSMDRITNNQVREFAYDFQREITSDEYLKIILIASNLVIALMENRNGKTILAEKDKLKEFVRIFQKFVDR